MAPIILLLSTNLIEIVLSYRNATYWMSNFSDFYMFNHSSSSFICKDTKRPQRIEMVHTIIHTKFKLQYVFLCPFGSNERIQDLCVCIWIRCLFTRMSSKRGFFFIIVSNNSNNIKFITDFFDLSKPESCR